MPKRILTRARSTNICDVDSTLIENIRDFISRIFLDFAFLLLSFTEHKMTSRLQRENKSKTGLMSKTILSASFNSQCVLKSSKS